ncbi:MAG: hypothetical protein ACPGUC_01475 [Gammaproteobacteria bacterium]
MTPYLRLLATLLLIGSILPSALAPAWADGDAAEAALGDVLFELDVENVEYGVDPDGTVNITFGAAVTPEEYSETLTRLKSHAAIPGVIAGRSSKNFCIIE